MKKRKGYCCKAFTLPYSPAGLRRKAQKAVKRDSAGKDDCLQVAAMVIYLGRRSVNPAFPDIKNQGGLKSHFYTCRHLKKNGDCAIYRDRPYMCRQYPNWHECQYKGCDCAAARRARKRFKERLEVKAFGFGEKVIDDDPQSEVLARPLPSATRRGQDVRVAAER